MKQPKELVKFVPEHDIKKMQFEQNDDFVVKRDEVVFEILYQTGMRQAELRTLQDKDIDKDLVKALLEKAETIAFNKGQVMIVADSKPFIVMELYNWIKTFSPQVSYEEAKNIDITKPFALVPASNLVIE